jgi:hypothetical protein
MIPLQDAGRRRGLMVRTLVCRGVRWVEVLGMRLDRVGRGPCAKLVSKRSNHEDSHTSNRYLKPWTRVRRRWLFNHSYAD